MPRTPQRAQDPDNPAHTITVRLPGWLKNQIIDHTETLGLSLNVWAANVLVTAMRTQQGLPEPPQAVRPLPTVADQIRAWAAGEQLTGPCGQLLTACALGDGAPVQVDAVGYCGRCWIRVM